MALQFWYMPLAEATATSVVEMAAAMVGQYGHAGGCPVTAALAKASKHRAEDQCHEASIDCYLFVLFPCQLSRLVCTGPRFRQNGLTLDVPISWVSLPSTVEDDRLFPVIKTTELVSALGRVGCLNKLFGDRPEVTIQDDLIEFWRRFAMDTPDHEVF